MRRLLLGLALIGALLVGVRALGGHNTASASARLSGGPAQPAPALTCPTVRYGQTAPAAMDEVPSVVPCNGAKLHGGDEILLPVTTSSAALSSDAAIAKARKLDDAPGLRITNVLLTSLTLPGSLPPPYPVIVPGTTTPVTWHPIKDHLVWLITFTTSAPVDVSMGSYPNHVPMMVTHDNVALDASTGEFVFGFYTK